MKRTLRFLISVLAVLFITTCISSSNQKPNPVIEINYCKTGCNNLEKLQCEKGGPRLTPWECESSAECPEENECINGYCGVTCIKFCEETVTSGKDLKQKCWAEINMCSEVETKCGV